MRYLGKARLASKRAYVVYPNPSDFELQLFYARRIEVIRFGTNQAEAVAGVLKAMAA